MNSVLIIGSGPIVIGQAAEFDYSGTQACLACREAGVRTILVNSNPATIMTDPEWADATYLEPLDAETIVVYQAYRPSIGRYAAEKGHFGGEFSLSRMSWIKPNFLWMMYRSGWGTKGGQEVTLAVRLRRDAFDEILRLVVHSTFVPEVYGTHEAWRQAVAGSDVRLQWDPDHEPAGNPLERRAIQLGLRADVLARYAGEWPLGIEDIAEFVAEQRASLRAHSMASAPEFP